MKKSVLIALLMAIAFYAKANHWTPVSNPYDNTVSLVGVVQMNGVEQFSSTLEVGAFSGDECRGSEMPMYVEQLNRYILFLTIFGDGSEEISFRLYDHSLNQEVDMTCASTVDFTPDVTYGSPSNPYILNFEGESDDDPLTYSINDDGVSVTVTGHIDGTAATGPISIPETKTINGVTYTVTAIGDNAFYNYIGLTGDLVIPNSVVTIGNSAFQNCKFTGLTIGNSVTTIGEFAFSECYDFTGELVFPNSLVTIGELAFRNCNNFTGDLVIPNSVVTIGNSAFSHCTGFDNLTIGNSVTTIGGGAFYDCTGFTGELVIPNVVVTIGSDAFSGCTGFIGNLTISNSVTTIGDRAFKNCAGFTGDLVIPNAVEMIGIDAFNGCTGFTGNLTIGNLVTTIALRAFEGCNGFTGILTIGPNVGSIGNSAFKNCSGFTAINVLAETPPQSTNTAFLNVNTSIPVTVPCGTLSAYQNATGWSNFTNIQQDCSGMYEVTATANPTEGGTVTGGGNYAEGNTCTLTALANEGYTFSSWMLGNEVVSTSPSYSFVVSGDASFVANFESDNDPLIYSINDDDVSVTVIGHVNGSAATGPIFIPATKTIDGVTYTVTKIGVRAFFNCTGLTGDLVIPNTVTTIGFLAFGMQNGGGFDGTLTLGNSVTDIANMAFYNCNNLTGELILPNSLTTIGARAFSGCSGFTGSLIIPESVEVISTDAFSNCTGLNGNLFIPGTITTLSSGAFFNCSGLTSITVQKAVPYIMSNSSFGDMNYDIPVTVPCGSGSLYRYALGWNLFSNIVEDCSDMYMVSATANPNAGGQVAFGTEGETLFADAFEEYTVGNLISPEAIATGHNWWRLWDTIPGSGTDGVVGLLGGNKCGHFTYGNDQVLYLGDKESGAYSLEFDILIPEGKNAYFSLLHTHVLGDHWSNHEALQCHLNLQSLGLGEYNSTPGHGTVKAGSNYLSDIPTVSDQWMHIRFFIDIDADVARFFITLPNEEETQLCEWPWNWGMQVNDETSLAGVDFWPPQNADSSEFYVDNIRLTQFVGGTPMGSLTQNGLHYFAPGSECVLTAITNDGYTFTNWTENGEVVSTDATYSFTVSADRTLVANFSNNSTGIEGVLSGVFSVSDTTQVSFSQGNLQYIGSATTPYWKFADHQWDYLGSTTGQNSSDENVDRDLFGWGTSGYDHGAECYQPWSIDSYSNKYYAYGSLNNNLYDQTGQADWGYNAISNGGNIGNIWRTLTNDEWGYVFNTRTASTVNGVDNARYVKGKVADVSGIILFPDVYVHPDGVAQPTNINSVSGAIWNEYSAEDFALMEANGAVFLPAAGYRGNTSVYMTNYTCAYWSSSYSNIQSAKGINFENGNSFDPQYNHYRYFGLSVRLVTEPQPADDDPLIYSINADGTTVTVIGHVDGQNATGTITIPETKTIDGVTYTVTAIGNFAFSMCTGLTGNLTIPNTVTTIGNYAFQACSGFNGTLTLGESVTTLGNGAFYLCSGFTGNLTLPNSITVIGKDTFASCSGFNGTLTLPEGLTSIGTYGFGHCEGLTGTLTLPDGLTSIGDYAFNHCENFTGSLTIPNTVTSIGQYAFYNCSGFDGSLTLSNTLDTIKENAFGYCSSFSGTLVIPSSVVAIDVEAFFDCTGFTGNLTLNEGLTSIGWSSFGNCTGFTGNLVIPNSVTTIDNAAFFNCESFTGLTLGQSVDSIGMQAFQHCAGFAAINSLAVNPPTLEWSAFGGINQDIPVTVPCGSMDAYLEAEGWSEFNNFEEDCGDHPGAISSAFSVSESTMVSFSKGNLQYRASTNTWRFANSQYDYIGNANSSISASYDGWIDLFAWGTSGYDHGADCYQPWSTNQTNSKYYAYGDSALDLNEQTGQADWGYNAISNGGNTENNEWRTLSRDEWTYVLNTRNTVSGIRYAKAKVNDVNGLILLPNNWNADYYTLNNANTANASFDSNTITAEEWTNIFEANGAVFLPSAGYRHGTSIISPGTYGGYFSVTHSSSAKAYTLDFNASFVTPEYSTNRATGAAVRLVRPAPTPDQCYISAEANPTEGGTVAGAGMYDYNATATLTATANASYTFVSWTRNGNVVSTEAEYSFTVTEDATFVANFELNSYEITAEANPEAGGTVTGAGTYDHGSNCTLTATANEGYTFLNWTRNGNVVSTNASYTFLVTAPMSYEANFELNSYEITATVSPAVGGSVTGTGTYDYGTTATLTATANAGYLFVNWTSNGEVVSTEAEYSFTVTEDAAFVAVFDIILPHWTYDPYQYSDNMSITGVIQIEGVEQRDANLEVGAFCNDECRGSIMPTYNADHDRYILYFTVYGQDGDVISFRLYDHTNGIESDKVCETTLIFGTNAVYGTIIDPYVFNFVSVGVITAEVNPAEGGTVTGTGTYNVGATATLTATPSYGYTFISWTLDGTVVSTDPTYSFTVTEDAAFVANFEFTAISQTTEFVGGWNWWSSYIELNENSLDEMQDDLGTNGVTIKSQNDGFNSYLAGYGWYGSLFAINNESSYQIRVSNACEVEMTGYVANPADHTITLNPGWSWIGYPVNLSMSVSDALAGITPQTNDMLKSQNNGFASYLEGYGWYGQLDTLMPSMGLMYKSMNNAVVTFTYPTTGVRSTSKAKHATDGNHWQPNLNAYADNMSVMAIVEFDGEELNSENYELAAFANGECRGSARLMYVEPLNRYMAFLTIAGDETTELYFGLYNAETGAVETQCIESLQYETNAVIGSFAEPYVVSFRGVTGMQEWANSLQIFPNPVEHGMTVNLGFSEAETGEVRVEIVNALGAVVETQRASTLQSITAPNATGVYTLRITVEGKGTCFRKLVVR